VAYLHNQPGTFYSRFITINTNVRARGEARTRFLADVGHFCFPHQWRIQTHAKANLSTGMSHRCSAVIARVPRRVQRTGTRVRDFRAAEKERSRRRLRGARSEPTDHSRIPRSDRFAFPLDCAIDYRLSPSTRLRGCRGSEARAARCRSTDLIIGPGRSCICEMQTRRRQRFYWKPRRERAIRRIRNSRARRVARARKDLVFRYIVIADALP